MSSWIISLVPSYSFLWIIVDFMNWDMAISNRLGRRPLPIRRHGLYLYDSWRNRFPVRLFSSQRLLRTIIISLAFIAVFPPIYFHISLRRFNQVTSMVPSSGSFSFNFFENGNVPYFVTGIWSDLKVCHWTTLSFLSCNVNGFLIITVSPKFIAKSLIEGILKPSYTAKEGT